MAQQQPKNVSAEEALGFLESRWAQRRSVREAFLSLDVDCDGVISPHELKAAIDGMGLSMSGPEFRRLWRRLDGAGEGKLTHAALSKVVGPLIFPSSWGFASTMCVEGRRPRASPRARPRPPRPAHPPPLRPPVPPPPPRP